MELKISGMNGTKSLIHRLSLHPHLLSKTLHSKTPRHSIPNVADKLI